MSIHHPLGFKDDTPTWRSRLKLPKISFLSLSHSIHVWYIYLYLPYRSTKRRQIYMDGVGTILKQSIQSQFTTPLPPEPNALLPQPSPSRGRMEKDFASQKPSKHLILVPWKRLSFPLAIAASCAIFPAGPPPVGCPLFCFWEQQHDDGWKKYMKLQCGAISLTVWNDRNGEIGKHKHVDSAHGSS